MIAIITHAVFYQQGEIYGPADAVSNYLSQSNIKHILIKHPLWGKHRSIIFAKEKKNQSQAFFGVKFEGLLRYPIDIYHTTIKLWSLEKPAIFIGVDPLNCIAGVVLKLLGRVDKLIYFTADFADTRFTNPILNAIYHTLDNICVNNATCCWSVSTRIVNYRKKQGVADEKNLFIPNAPAFSKIHRLPINEVDKNQLIIVSNLQAGVEFDAIFEALLMLRKKHPKVHLVIIGGGEGESDIREAVKKYKLQKYVSITGRLPHDKVHELLAKSGIGIALYNDTASWRYYSDSMKARDYLACSLPVLISGDLATVDDIISSEAGLAIAPTADNIAKSVEKVLCNYLHYRNNATALAKKFDIEKILKLAFEKVNS